MIVMISLFLLTACIHLMLSIKILTTFNQQNNSIAKSKIVSYPPVYMHIYTIHYLLSMNHACLTDL